MEHIHGQNMKEFISIGTIEIEINRMKCNKTYWLIYCNCGKGFAYTGTAVVIEEYSAIKTYLVDTSQLTINNFEYTDKSLKELRKILIED